MSDFERLQNDEIADPERLAALESYGILDTPAEEGFDDVVHLACDICLAPFALVSFVAADRQWFKARVGFDVCQTPLEQSVCAYALQEPEMLVIPDLSLDPRTRDNPLVVGDPFARFYAGVVLRSPEGHALGTLCVLDVVPRPAGLTERQTSGLLALGRHVAILLALRRSVDNSREAVVQQHFERRRQQARTDIVEERELKLRLAVEATQIGIFDYDVSSGTLEWDARTRQLFSEPPDTVVTYEGSFLKGLHPDDRETMDGAVRDALDPAGTGLFDVEYRTVSPTGEVRWVAARGRAVFADGDASRLIGTVRDVTVRRTADDRIAALLERYTLVGKATNDAIWDWDLVTDQVIWNEAVADAYGWPLDEVEPTPQWWLDRIHPEDRQRTYDDIKQVIDGGGSEWRHEYRFRRADGHYADVFDRGNMIRDARGAPLRMIGAMFDLTERKEAEEQFRAVFEGANVGIVELDPRNARAIRVNAKLCEIWGTTEAEILGHSLARWTPEEDDSERAELHGRLARGETIKALFEKRYRRADGRIIWARVNLVSRRLRDGVQATAMIEDITGEKQEKTRQDALVELASRLRDLGDARSVAEVACDILGRTLKIDRASFGAVDLGRALVSIDVDWRAIDVPTAVGTHALDRFGDMADIVTKGQPFAVADVAFDPRTSAHCEAYQAIGVRSLLHVPILERGALVAMFFLHSTVENDWSPEIVAFVRMVADRTRAAVARARAEERQRILNHELSHRMKNLLTMVQAIAGQTMRGATTMEGARDVLTGRLHALSKAHDLLLDGAAQGARLKALVTEAVGLHADSAKRIAISGPDVEIGSKATMPIILMMHELGTNAVKYGALSNDRGRVALACSVSGAPGEETVNLVWSEHDGPPVSSPSRTGFGTRLIERGLAAQMGATVTIDYPTSGVICVLEAPLSRLQESD